MIPSDTFCVPRVSFLKQHCVVKRLFLFYSLILWACWCLWKHTGPVSGSSTCNSRPQEKEVCRCADIVSQLYWDLFVIPAQFFPLDLSFWTPFWRLEGSARSFLCALVTVCWACGWLTTWVEAESRRARFRKNIAPEQLCLGLFWKEPSRILAGGKAVRVRVMTSCTSAVRLQESRCHEPEKVPSRSRADLLYPHHGSRQIAVFTALTGICQPFLGATPDISGGCILPCACPSRNELGLFSFPEIHCELLGQNRMCK